MTRRLSTPALIGRHLRTAPGAPTAVAILVAALSALAVFAPLALTAVSDASLRYRVDALSPALRDVKSVTIETPPRGSGADWLTDLRPPMSQEWGLFDAGLEQNRRNAGVPLSDAMARAQYVMRQPFGVPADRFSLEAAQDPRFADHVALTAGRWPAEPPEDWAEVVERIWLGEEAEVPPVEIILSEDSADQMEWAMGDVRSFPSVLRPEGLPFVLVGTFGAVSVDDPYWQHVGDVVHPAVHWDTENQPYVRATGYVDPRWIGTLPADGPVNAETTVWSSLDTATITARDAGQILSQLRGFTSTAQVISAGPDVPSMNLRFATATTQVLARAVAEGQTLRAVFFMVAAGPVGVAAAVLVLGCRMLVERRRAALALLSARGASPGQRRKLMAIEGAVVGVVPAAVGAALGAGIAWLLLRDVGEVAADDPALYALPALLAIAPAAVLAVAATARGRRERADAPARPSRWRVVVELAVIGLAAGATALLIVRGGAVADDGAIDPLVVIAPLLLALVVCVLTLRVYPFLLRIVLERVRRGDGFTGFLGAARALRDPATGLAPVLALVVGLAVAVSSAVLLSTVQEGVRSTADAAAGADLQLSLARFPDGAVDGVSQLDGVEAAAAIGLLRTVELQVDSVRSLVDVYVVDPAALATAQQGYAPLVPEGVDLGDGATPVPMLFSGRAFDVTDPVGELALGREPAQLAGVAYGTTPLGAGSSWVMIAEPYAPLIRDNEPAVDRILVNLDAGTDPAVVLAEARALFGENVRGRWPASIRADIESGPAVVGLSVALIACVALSALLCAIAVVMTLVLGGRSRARILALLQTLGAPPRSGRALIGWELWPACVAALVAGAVYGAVLPLLLLAAIDLRPFAGSSEQPGYFVDPLTVALAVGGFLLVTAVFTLIALAISRRVRAAAILRTVEDS